MGNEKSERLAVMSTKVKRKAARQEVITTHPREHR